VFERFTAPARQVVVVAADEARALGHGYVGTEHLLLGLLRDGEGIAARVLGELGVDADTTRVRIEAAIGRGPETPSPSQIPFTPRAKDALEQSTVEARGLGHGIVGTEHVLLALVAEPKVVAVEVLDTFGVSAQRVRAAVLDAFGGA
jgi:ATP-dependent Clp protease ATP-binding subunit ClpC